MEAIKLLLTIVAGKIVPSLHIIHDAVAVESRVPIKAI